MASNLIFGWHLDSAACPNTAIGARSNVGTAIVGSAGLNELLATRLGLGRVPVGQSLRIARYLAALSAGDDFRQFYSKSFQLDAWSTASYLLILRDELISNGWDGKHISDCGSRIAGIAAVEQHASGINSPAEIMRDALFCLREGMQARIDHVKLATDLALLPHTWQQILQMLQAQGTIIDAAAVATNRSSGVKKTPENVEPMDASDEDCDLAKLQRFLVDGEKSELVGDGSLILLEADDELQLAEAVSTWLINNRLEHEGIVIIRGTGSSLLDAACERRGLPRIGGHDQSQWRGTMQVLQLALENCWWPANPLRILELLSLPNSPVTHSVGYHFAKALRREPGFGGDSWSNAWRDALAGHRVLLAGQELDDKTIDRKVNELERELKFWLEPERHSPASGIPAGQVQAVCKRVRQWAAAANVNSNSEKTLFSELNSLSQEFEDAVSATGYAKITRIQLGRILDAAIGEGVSAPSGGAQAAEWSLVNHPGQIWAPADRVLWWNFTAQSASTRCFTPWTRAERAGLQKHGIILDTAREQIAREADAWRQPFLHARKEVILARPRVLYGEPVAIHPIWHELDILVSEGSNCVIKQQAHELFSKPKSKLGLRQVELSQAERAPLPLPIRYWQVPPAVISPRASESASSIETLLGCPMAWALQYHAQMHQGALLTVPDGNQLIGNIAHAVFKTLFERAWKDDTAIEETAANLCDQIIEATGLPLLLPGRKVERERVRYLIAKAAKDFADLIKNASLDVADCEILREGQFGETHFEGYIDALLVDASGKNYVIDHKWATRHRYRVEEMEHGHHMQLAAYSWLQSCLTGAFPEAGYYMIRQRRLLFTDSQPFSTAQHVSSNSLQVIWDQIVQSYNRELQQLTEGWICASGVSSETPVPAELQQLEKRRRATALQPDAVPSTAHMAGTAAPPPPPTIETAVSVGDGAQLQLKPPCKFCLYGRICGAKGYANE